VHSLNGLFPYVHTDAVASLRARVRWRAVHPSLRTTVLVTDDPPLLSLGDAAKLPAAVGALHPVAQLAHHIAHATDGLRAGVARVHTAWNDVAAPVATVFDRIDSALQHIDGIYAYVLVCVCVSVCLLMSAYTHVCVCVRRCMCLSVCVCALVCICVPANVRVRV
jgi:hypothetical protein